MTLLFYCYAGRDNTLLEMTPVEDVWNIGPKRAWLLATELNIHTALQLKHAPDRWVKQRLSVVGLRVVLELRGIPCVPLETFAAPKQQIACAQAFGEPVVWFSDIGTKRSTSPRVRDRLLYMVSPPPFSAF